MYVGLGAAGLKPRRMRSAKRSQPTVSRIGASSLISTAKPAPGRTGDGDAGRVAELLIRGVGVLAGDAADGERVAAVGGDVDLDGRLVEAEEFDRVLAGNQVLRLESDVREHDDARVIFAQAELALGADHAVGPVAVGLAPADGERPWQRRAGQNHHYPIALNEVVGTTDDAAAGGVLSHVVGRMAGASGVVELAHVDAAVVDGLAVGLRLLDEREHAAHDERAAHAAALDALLLEANARQGGGDVLWGGAGEQVYGLGEPGQGNLGHVRPPRQTAGRSARRPRPCHACP